MSGVADFVIGFCFSILVGFGILAVMVVYELPAFLVLLLSFWYCSCSMAFIISLIKDDVEGGVE